MLPREGNRPLAAAQRESERFGSGVRVDDRSELQLCGVLRAGSGEVECDEVYVVAGHKGQPAAVAKRGVPADAGG